MNFLKNFIDMHKFGTNGEDKGWEVRIDTLSYFFKVSPRTIRRYLNTLIKASYIEITNVDGCKGYKLTGKDNEASELTFNEI